jgi:DNA-binding response OmpR family regulator/REP element-mobilizing transposase RayT
MVKYILVATPNAAFGELLQLSLEKNGEYQVTQVSTAIQAITHASLNSIDLAILDYDLPGQSLAILAADLHAKQPDMRLMVIPPENNPDHPLLKEIKVDGYIGRPFYLPDMIASVEKIVSPTEPKTGESSQAIAIESPLPNLEQNWEIYVGQKLTSLTLESSTHAAIITSKGQTIAYTGRLKETAVQQIAVILEIYWDWNEKSDLVRYIRLESPNKGEYLVYATLLSDDLFLSLVNDNTTPLTRIRAQAHRLTLALFPESGPLPSGSANLPSMPVEKGKPDLETLTKDQPPPVIESPTNSATPALGEETITKNQEDGADEAGQISLAELQATMPPDTEEVTGFSFKDWMPEIENQVDSNSGISDDSDTISKIDKNEKPESLFHSETEDQGVSKTSNPDENSCLNDGIYGETEPTGDTIPILLQELTQLSEIEPVSPAFSRLCYTCMIIPRMPHHYLTGDLGSRLGQWVSQCCLSFGWRLEGLSVRPDYVQWSVQVPPSVSPGNLIRILRQRTSHEIFRDFPHLLVENPSGDYWAPGYLIVSGSQLLTSRMQREFIVHTRRRQGVRQK